MTSTPRNHPSQDGAPAVETGTTPAGVRARKLQDDPRAQLALAKKNHAASPAAATGAGHAKAAHESSKQGKKEKKVRW
ncbi:hypothetical protein [Arthrobacter sp. TMS1-12-1]